MVTRSRSFLQNQFVVATALGAALAVAFGGMLAFGDLAAHVPETVALGLAAGIVYFVALFALGQGAEKRAAFWMVLCAGVLFRALLFPSPQSLSDDVHRYRWEGRQQLAGWNPYAVPPTDSRVASLRDESWRRMPGRDIATIYPPWLELVFRETSRALDGVPLERQIILFKLPFVTGDLLILAMLAWRLRREGDRAVQLAVYAWNPLVIVEFAGNGHMDALAMAALLAAWLLLEQQRKVTSALLLAAGVLLKVFPIVLAPLWLRRMGWPRDGKSWLGAAGALGLAAMAWWPFRGAEAALLETLAYYESRWQNNNASLYALLRWASGSHELAAGIGAGVVAGLALWAAARHLEPLRAILVIVAVLLLLSPNGYPWYFTWLLPFLCLARVGSFGLAWLLLTVTQFVSYEVVIRYHALGIWRFEPFYVALTYGPFFALLVWNAVVARGQTPRSAPTL